MTMNIPGRSSAPDAVLDPRIDDLLLRLRGLVLVGGYWKRGAPRPPRSRSTPGRPIASAPSWRA